MRLLCSSLVLSVLVSALPPKPVLTPIDAQPCQSSRIHGSNFAKGLTIDRATLIEAAFEIRSALLDGWYA